MTILGLANGRFDSPEDVSLASVTTDSIETLRKLNAVLFPIPYSEQFYNAVVTPELSRFCKIIHLNGKAVGTICCRSIEEDGETKLYIMTMGVLADYRDKRLGSKALQDIIDAARSGSNPRILSIFMHVWAMNPDAKRFYERHGFVESSLAVNCYYKAPIECKDAWALELRLHPSVAKGEGQEQPVEHDDISSATDKSNPANGTA